MERILQTYLEKQYKDGNLFFLGDINEIIDMLDDIKTDYLYKNNFHGLYHSQKVCFFAYLIGIHEKLSKEDMQIVLDAAKYHDIGRESDYEEDLHGLKSAQKIDKIINYENKNDMYYLKAIIESHNHADNDDFRVFNNWVYQKESDELVTNVPAEPLNYDRFKRLSNILKDADALDRFRFSNCSAVLEEKFLRNEYSKKLMSLSKMINKYYLQQEINESYSKLSKYYSQDKVDKKLCYHSIGFDFFKMESILKYGIVSHYNAIANNIPIYRNFNGNNGEFWISVVDADSNLICRKAFETYVKEKISFLCYVDELVEGVSRPKDNGSLEPRKSSEYPDEKFVFDKIPLECIQYISIPRAYINSSIKDLDYLFCNSQYEVVKSNVDNYMTELEKLCDITFNHKDISEVLEKMKLKQIENNNQSRIIAQANNDTFNKIMDHMKAELNIYIQEYMQIGFAQLLGKNYEEKITLKEVIDFLLKKYGIDYTIIDDQENEDNEFESISLPFMHDEHSYLLRLSTFDLNKNQDSQNRTI